MSRLTVNLDRFPAPKPNRKGELTAASAVTDAIDRLGVDRSAGDGPDEVALLPNRRLTLAATVGPDLIPQSQTTTTARRGGR